MKAFYSTRTVLPGSIEPAVVLVADGKILNVLKGEAIPGNIEVIDAGDKILMPGVIDTHVHINEPGRTDWEGFDTATAAAIAGGITLLVDMPLNSSPVTTTAAAFDEKVKAAQNKLHTNVGFWGGVVPGNANDIEALVHKGVLGFKAFLTHSGIDDFPNATEADLHKVMPILARYKRPLLVHAELTDTEPRCIPGEEQSYLNYLHSRPKSWEDNAVAMMIRLCEQYNCPVHIVHLSSANSIEQIAAAKQKGLPLTVETGQHYLYFTAEEIPDGQTAYKCAPPIREKQNNEKLWQALQDGIIDFVATDHSPATPSLKETESGNFMKAWGGIASLQFALPVLWTAARKRGFTFKYMAKWLCENPAKLAGLAASKGKIAAGYDADLIVVDDAKSFTVTEDIILHKHKLTPYLNQQLFGVVTQTWLGGQKVFDTGVLEKNKGKIIYATN